MSPRMPRQDSTSAQLLDVSRMAVQAGCYDADDVIKRHLSEQTDGLRYFHLNHTDYCRATQAVWALEDKLGLERTGFSMRAIGMDTSVWTPSWAAQRLLRAILIHMGAEFEESDQQQVAKSN